MCNHYRCDDDEELAYWIEREFSHTAIRPLAVSRPRLPRERWPRKPALIVVEQAGGVAIEEVRWGVWPSSGIVGGTDDESAWEEGPHS